jgi:hypothetical protein
MNTPWGKSDYRHEIERGVNWVGTPSHGGLVVTEKVAREKLTPEAIAQGEWYGSLICFEEDCAYAVALFEVPEWCEKSVALWAEKRTPEEWHTEFYRTITVWCLDYLRACGLPPIDSESEARYYQIRRELDEWQASNRALLAGGKA